MNRKKITTGVAAVGVLAGTAGLVLVAIPAGAGPAPTLPKTTPEALVTSVLSAKPAAFGGTVVAQSNLGMPIPGMSANTDGSYQGKVYSDGQGRSRISFSDSKQGDRTMIDDGTTAWSYTAGNRQVTKTTEPAKAKDKAKGQMPDPATVSKQVIGQVEKNSTIAIDGTTQVAGRDSYELVLNPKPSEKTLVREVRVAIDAQTKMPLRFEMFGNGSADPALEVGFSQFDSGQQDPALFTFTPPAGSKVTTVNPGSELRKQGEQAKKQLKSVGDGWDTVVTGSASSADLGKLAGGAAKHRPGAPGQDQSQLLDKFTKPVSGSFGSGRLVQTSIGTAILTSDGRFAAGLVPEQVLEQALTK